MDCEAGFTEEWNRLVQCNKTNKFKFNHKVKRINYKFLLFSVVLHLVHVILK